MKKWLGLSKFEAIVFYILDALQELVRSLGGGLLWVCTLMIPRMCTAYRKAGGSGFTTRPGYDQSWVRIPVDGVLDETYLGISCVGGESVKAGLDMDSITTGGLFEAGTIFHAWF